MSFTIRILIIAVAILFFNCTLSFSQFMQNRYLSIEKKENPEGQLDLILRAAAFFSNNEFFGTETEGYTLIGDFLQPVLKYSLSDQLTISGGGHYLRYYGRTDGNELIPFISMEYKLLNNLSLVMGNYNTGGDLKLPEVLYKFERQFSDLPANGILISKKGDIWESETWLDWKKFIEPGDLFQERFVAGHSGVFSILRGSKNKLKIPLYLIAEHKGGQINNNHDPVTTRMDLGTGLSWEKKFDAGPVRKFSLSQFFFVENEASGGIEGKSAYSYTEISHPYYFIGGGYFSGDRWQSILGESLFFSRQTNTHPEAFRSGLLTFKCGFSKALFKHSFLNLKLEAYQDIYAKKLQYSYGVQLLVTEFRTLIPGKKR